MKLIQIGWYYWPDDGEYEDFVVFRLFTSLESISYSGGFCNLSIPVVGYWAIRYK